jgi:hypothetical protein
MMSTPLKIEFFTVARIGVGKIVETKILSGIEKNTFEEWAQRALSVRRCDNYLGTWPDGVRAIGPDGRERYRWTLRDEAPLRNASKNS